MTARRPAPGTGRRPSSGRGTAPARRSSSSSTRSRRGGADPRPRRRLVAGLVVSVVFVGFLLVGVFPTRAWLAQRQELQARQAELDTLDDRQSALEDDVAELQTPGEIERIARQEYGMTREGETAFRMLPGAEDPVDLPDTWPFSGTEDWLNR